LLVLNGMELKYSCVKTLRVVALAGCLFLSRMLIHFMKTIGEMNIEDPDGHRFRIGSESKGEPDNLSLPE